MIRHFAQHRPLVASVIPTATCAVIGTACAWADLRWTTFVIGAPTPLIALGAPMLVLCLRAQASSGRPALTAASAVAINLAIEAGTSAAQLALLSA